MLTLPKFNTLLKYVAKFLLGKVQLCENDNLMYRLPQFWGHRVWVRKPAPSLTSWVILGLLFNISALVSTSVFLKKDDKK